MRRLSPHQVSPGATDGQVLTTVTGKAQWAGPNGAPLTPVLLTAGGTDTITVAPNTSATLRTLTVTVAAGEMVELHGFAQVRSTATAAGFVYLRRDGVDLTDARWHNEGSSSARLNPVLFHKEKPGAGTYTYTLVAANDVGSGADALAQFARLTVVRVAGGGNPAAADVGFTPAGNLAATDVQAALEELDAEKSGVGHVHAVPRARVTRTTLPPALANATTTVVDWEAEEYDTDDLWAVSPNPSRIVLNRVGLWLVFGSYSFGGSSTGRRVSMIWRNGAAVARSAVYPTDATAPDVPVSSPVLATATTDYVELRVYQSSGGSLASAAGTESFNWLAAFYLGS